MEEEVRCFIRVWLVAVPAAFTYCYSLLSLLRAGKWRLLALLPVVVLFALLPLSFSTVHGRLISASILSWLAIFKLLLFAFDHGPLCDASATKRLSLPSFFAIASLPIMIRRKPPSSPRSGRADPVLTLLGFAVKGLILASIISLYPQRPRFHRGVVLALYTIHMYLALDLGLACAAALGRALLPAGTALEPQFAPPYLCSSLQDFWGRRWNLMVSGILRSAVHDPIRVRWGPTAGVMASFLVSGLMHEVIFFYVTLQPPTGEVASFFVLHGLCTVAEIAAKRWWTGRGMTPLHPAVATPLTIGFLLATGRWLFAPQILRISAEELIVKEAEAVGFLFTGVVARAG
ncbi:unnamed protein product [Spirodela intermedia]|uniref:Wax synthase domain-containing protein n=2 Tax=Spirodela intermedia TaxID=51605 RepID=A0A7I8ID83_SPIIN|nr:unnamed protein product [Spirodela intermedia]CAA6655758.1 unnamed protein product [Spirodela intermedia]CAA7391108.1 unnamed protein product [Spirodela intermedia]